MYDWEEAARRESRRNAKLERGIWGNLVSCVWAGEGVAVGCSGGGGGMGERLRGRGCFGNGAGQRGVEAGGGGGGREQCESEGRGSRPPRGARLKVPVHLLAAATGVGRGASGVVRASGGRCEDRLAGGQDGEAAGAGEARW